MPSRSSSSASDPKAPDPDAAGKATGLGGSGQPPGPGLHVVALPIGNARDITLRALDILSAADCIAAEDTRTTSKLLAVYGITTSLLPYHEHNAAEMRPRLLARLGNAETVALVSDAGTPLISDPGFKLVQAAVEAGIRVVPAPGASAVLAALMAAGLPTDRFTFLGFPPARQAARQRLFADCAQAPFGSLVLFEAARRLPDCLGDLAASLGDRPAAVLRELTKRYEEVRRDTLSNLARHYAAEGPPKGEVVVVIGPPVPGAAALDGPQDLDRLLREALARETVKAAVKRVAAVTGLPRNLVYDRALAVKGDGQD